MTNRKKLTAVMAVALITLSFVCYTIYLSPCDNSMTVESDKSVIKMSIVQKPSFCLQDSLESIGASQNTDMAPDNAVCTLTFIKKVINPASRGKSYKSHVSRSGPSSSSIWPADGVVTSVFGPRWGTFHCGIDIGAPYGSNVYAFRSGKVIFSGWNAGGYGNLVIIDHGNGLQSYYGHNLKLLVEAGHMVDKGQVIAKVGSTGDSTGPHSHFEIRQDNIPVNPYNYLK